MSQSHNRLFRAMDEVGDGSGVKNHISDYLVTGVGNKKALLTPSTDQIFDIATLQIFIQDNLAVGSDKYGGAKALDVGKGMLLYVEDEEANVVTDLFDGGEVITNAGWALISGNIHESGIGSGDNYLFSQINFLAKVGDYLHVDGRAGESLALHLRDDLSSLIKHFFMCIGRIRPQPPRSVDDDPPVVVTSSFDI